MLDQLDDPVPFTPSPELVAAARVRGSRLRRRRRLGVTGALIPVILVLALVAGAVYVDHRLDQVQRVDVAAGVLAPVAAGAPFNVLVVGTDGPRIDGRDDGVRRSDTMMILHVDESGGVLRSMSLPRDLVFDAGGTTTDRLNTFLPSGGPDALITAIHDHLGIAIAHYVEIDFTGFERVVDAVGGLTVQPSSALRDANTGLDLGAGCQHVDGTQALQLVRARHLEYQDADGRWILDPTGDIGRMEHQQDLYRLVLTQLSARLADPVTLNALLDALVGNATLDAGFDRGTLLRLATGAAHADGTYSFVLSLPVEPFTTPAGAAVLRLGARASSVIDALDAPVGQEGPGYVDPGTTPGPTRSSAVALYGC
jgi:LCP family protein required for cell wall assembly